MMVSTEPNLLISLNTSSSELDNLITSLTENTQYQDMSNQYSQELINAIKNIQRALEYSDSTNIQSGVIILADIDTHIFMFIVSMLIQFRQRKFESLIYDYEMVNSALRSHQQVDRTVETNLVEQNKLSTSQNMNRQKRLGNEPQMSDLTLGFLMNWAIKNNVKPDIAERTYALITNLSLPSTNQLTLTELKKVYSSFLDDNRGVEENFKVMMSVEPIGFLHLERLNFIPVGEEPGELLYTVPLAPGEEVNISHKEWSQTTREFESIVSDFMEGYSEEGVAEKNELAESTNSQNQHASAFNTQVTASGEAGSFDITASVGYNASESASRSEQLTLNRSNAITKKAASRVKKNTRYHLELYQLLEVKIKYTQDQES